MKLFTSYYLREHCEINIILNVRSEKKSSRVVESTAAIFPRSAAATTTLHSTSPSLLVVVIRDPKTSQTYYYSWRRIGFLNLPTGCRHRDRSSSSRHLIATGRCRCARCLLVLLELRRFLVSSAAQHQPPGSIDRANELPLRQRRQLVLSRRRSPTWRRLPRHRHLLQNCRVADLPRRLAVYQF